VKGPAPSFRDGRTVVCYRLAKANSATQPFVLERLGSNEVFGSGFYRPCGDDGKGETDSQGQRLCGNKDAAFSHHWSACSTWQDPMLMNQVLVVGIDVSDLGDTGVNIDQLKALNINVTNQAGSALNPSPIRASFPAPAGGGGGGAGSSTPGSPGPMDDAVGEESGWVPVGTHAPEGTRPQHWHERHDYEQGDVVTDPSEHRYFIANSSFRSGPKPIDPFPAQPRVERIIDGEVIWQEMNEPAEEHRERASRWAPQTDYPLGAVVCTSRSGAEDGLTGGAATFAQNTFSLLLANRSLLPPSCEVEKKRLEKQAPTLEQQRMAARLEREAARLRRAAVHLEQRARKLGEPEGGDLSRRAKALLEDADAKLDLAEKYSQEHLHYYLAVKRGKSGSTATDPLSVVLVTRAIYLTWPYQLPGDVIPTFTVNLVYTPPVPGAPWQGDTFYPAGSVVTSSSNNGRFYTALTGGISSAEPREPDLPVDVPPTTDDGDLVWLDSGTTVPSVSAASSQSSSGQGSGQGGGQGGGGGGGQGGGQSAGGGNGTAGKAQQWLARSHYLLGDVILNPYNGHYYTMIRSKGGISGNKPGSSSGTPACGSPSTGTQSGGPFPQIPLQTTLTDGDILWLETGTPTQDPWKPHNDYKLNQSFKASNGFFYKMIGSTASQGNSRQEPAKPFPPTPDANQRVPDGDLYWMYSSEGAAAKEWHKDTQFSLGDSVLDDHGHMYVMVGTSKGKSGPAEPVAQNVSGQPATVSDGDLLWADIGITTSSQPPPGNWLPNHNYRLGEVVHSTTNCHYYQAIHFTAGISGPEPQSPFPVVAAGDRPTSVFDGTIVWTAAADGIGREWKANSAYAREAVVYAKDDPSHLWKATNSGRSGEVPAEPPFRIMQPSTVIEAAVPVRDGLTWRKATPVIPGDTPPQPWASGTYYRADRDVSYNNVHYIALTAGVSGDHPPFPATWEALGSVPPVGPLPPEWIGGTYYEAGFVVSYNHRYFKALTGGRSGDLTLFAVVRPETRIRDNSVNWEDSGVIRPIGLLGQPLEWAAYHPYKVGNVVFVPGLGNGRYYTASTAGTSGDASPFVSLSPSLPVTWQNSGTTAPASVATGQPADQNVSLINLALPQTHSLSYFNISAGAIFTFNRNPTYGYVSAVGFKNLPSKYTAVTTTTASAGLMVDPGTGCSYSPTPDKNGKLDAYFCPSQTGLGAHTVDPVLVLTVYFPPVDAEVPWRIIRRGRNWWRDLIPAPSIGMSLANPTTNFYVGGSMEAFIRNVQVFGGMAFQNVATGLGTLATQPAWGGLAPVPTVSIVSGFRRGFFVGMTYNLSGFVQSLFSAAK
jgi:hypothetical protein